MRGSFSRLPMTRVGLAAFCAALLGGTHLASAQLVTLDLLDGRLDALETQYGDVNKALSTLKTQDGEALVQLGKQSDAVAKIGADLGTLRTGIDGLDAATATLRRDVDTNAGGLAALKGGLGATDGRLDATVLEVARLNQAVDDLQALLGDDPDTGGPTAPSKPTDPTDPTKPTDPTNPGTPPTPTPPTGGPSVTDVLKRHDSAIADNTREIGGAKTRLGALEANDGRQDATLADHESRLSANGEAIGALANSLEHQSERISVATEGVAMALAMKSPTVAEDKRFALSGSVGTFESKQALAVSAAVRANEFVQFDGGIAVGLDSGSVGGRAGATIAW